MVKYSIVDNQKGSGSVAGDKLFFNTIGPHGAPFVMVTVQPDLRQVFKLFILGNIANRQVTVIVINRHAFGVLVLEEIYKSPANRIVPLI